MCAARAQTEECGLRVSVVRGARAFRWFFGGSMCRRTSRRVRESSIAHGQSFLGFFLSFFSGLVLCVSVL